MHLSIEQDIEKKSLNAMIQSHK